MIEFRDSNNIITFNEKQYYAERGIEIEYIADIIDWLKGRPLKELEKIANELVEKETDFERQAMLFDVISALKNTKIEW